MGEMGFTCDGVTLAYLPASRAACLAHLWEEGWSPLKQG